MEKFLMLVLAPNPFGKVLTPNIQAAGIDWQALGNWLLPVLIDFITFLLLGSLLIWLLPRPFERWADKARHAPVKSFGVGILFVFGGYLGVLLGFVLIIGIALFLFFIKFNALGGIVLGLGLPAVGLFFGALTLVVAFISKLVVVFLVGNLLLARFFPKGLAHRFWPLLLGLVIYLLITLIPWLGWVVSVVVTLVGLGAIWLGWPKKTADNPLPPQPPAFAAEPEE